uniref:Transmembrane protein 53 n=1 Tax=Aegilops tauschii subsp. strangulata TaxID=200361 RepID=A0A453TD77_AEGTS
MASFHRPLSAMAVAAFAAVSSIELPDKFSHHNRLPDDVVSLPASKPEAITAPSAPPLSGLQFMPRNLQAFDPAKAPVASLPVIQTVYQYARFAKTSPEQEVALPAIPSSSSDALYRWHLPDPRACHGSPDRSQTVVVLLGWLGSKQKHLKRYADWYTSRGFHAVTFTLPMSDIVSYNVGGKAEKNVEMLSEHLGDWVREEDGKKIVFHTFSNTGWLCYGVILENLQRQDPSAVEKIKGSIIDSAPVAVPDSQVKTVANLTYLNGIRWLLKSYKNILFVNSAHPKFVVYYAERMCRQLCFILLICISVIYSVPQLLFLNTTQDNGLFEHKHCYLIFVFFFLNLGVGSRFLSCYHEETQCGNKRRCTKYKV